MTLSEQAAATYLFFAPMRLAPGSVIYPGNYGRVIQRYHSVPQSPQTFGGPWILARELQFELVRVTMFAIRPSRLEAAFCLPDDVENAEAYRSKIDIPRTQVLHRVTLVDPRLATHFAPFEVVDLPVGEMAFLPATYQRAVAYWSGYPQGIQEVVTLSALRVSENID
jgi:hypothetical protein